MGQGKTIRELEIVVKGYEDNLGERSHAVREDVESEYEETRRGQRRKLGRMSSLNSWISTRNAHD